MVKDKKVSCLCIIMLLLFLILQGCSTEHKQKIGDDVHLPASTATCNIVKNIAVDNYTVIGKTETKYNSVPNRVIVVGENEIETLLALGVEKNIIAAIGSNSSNYFVRNEYSEAYKQLTIFDSTFLNVESLLALKPDLIVAEQCIFVEKRLRSTEFWNSRGIHTFVPLNTNSPLKHRYMENIEQEYDFILGLGKIFNVEEKANAIVEEIKNEIAEVVNKTKNRKKQKVMIIEFFGGRIVSYDATKLAGDMCTRLGAVVPVTQPAIGLEDLFDEDPDALFVVQTGEDINAGANRIKSNEALRNLRCIKNGRVYGISLRKTYNSSIKTIDGIKEFARGIYPDLYENN